MKSSNGEELPMTRQHYSITINNNISTFHITQTYKNKSKTPVEISWSFPVPPNSGITSLQISLSNRTLTGKLIEKSTAEEKYEDAISKGNTGYKMNYEGDQKLDILQMSIGNMKAEEEVTVHIGMVVTLEYDPGCWKLCVPAIYTNSFVDVYMGYIWELDCVITSNTPILGIHSTHHIDEYTLTEDKKSITMKMSGNNPLEDDIEIRYRTEEVENQRIDVMKNKGRGEIAAVISFFPIINTRRIEDIDLGTQNASKQDINTQTPNPPSIICEDISEIVRNNNNNSSPNTAGEYIIILDCSGSMRGNKITIAKSACILFMRSLPLRSLFNIYLFGSTYITLFQGSEEYTQDNMQKALHFIQLADADMGSTNLSDPLRGIYSSLSSIDFPRSLFVLTDGDVLNSEEVFKLVTDNVHTTRVHTLGISSSASKYLVKQCGIKGKGSYHFVDHVENLGDKVIQTLEIAMRPSLSGLSLEIPKGYKMKYSSRDINNLGDIRGDEAFILSCILEGDLNVGGKFVLRGTNTWTKKEHEYSVYMDNMDVSESNILESSRWKSIRQLAVKEIISHNKGSLKEGEEIKLSLEYGVLTSHTAFFLEEKGAGCREDVNIMNTIP